MKYEDRAAINTREAAELLGMSRRKVQLMAKHGQLPHRKAGKMLLFSPRQLREWVEGGYLNDATAR